MLKDRLLKHKLGNIKDLRYIYNLIYQHNTNLKDLQSYCRKSSFQLGESFNGVMSLLFDLNIISIDENDNLKIDIAIDHQVAEFSGQFYRILFIGLDEWGLLSLLFTRNNLVYDQDFQTYVVKENHIPFKFYNIKNFFLESDFFHRNELINNLLMLNADYFDIFTDHVIDMINTYEKVSRTIEDLKRDIEQKEIYGEEAEQFVLIYEQMRLRDHSQKEKIVQISNIDVSAGFDIQSFHTNSSVLLDRFIEVKSYERKIKFFWSSNEIKTARALRKDYFLYLVDRSQMHREDYEPIMIQDPYNNVFANEDGWQKEVQTWMLTNIS